MSEKREKDLPKITAEEVLESLKHPNEALGHYGEEGLVALEALAERIKHISSRPKVGFEGAYYEARARAERRGQDLACVGLKLHGWSESMREAVKLSGVDWIDICTKEDLQLPGIFPKQLVALVRAAIEKCADLAACPCACSDKILDLLEKENS